jgi:CDP-4-dehydro-6-deoxyglucose reductase, E3
MTFTIRIEPSGHTFSAEAGEKILEAALRQGITLAYSCRNGACGTCKAQLRAGQVDYGDYEQKALTDAERNNGKVLLCQAKALSDVTVEAHELVTPAGIVIKTLPARVAKMERAAHDVMILQLTLPQNQRLAFLAGQYIEILLKDNQRRSFSLANPPRLNEIPGDEFLEIHERHVPGGLFTDHVFNKMQERDLLRFRGPLGTFFLREESERPIIFIAGGTGFAPIKGIIEHAFAKGIKRPMHLYWGVRAKRDLYRHELAESWAQSHPQLRYTPVLSEPAAEDAWQGRTGFVHEAAAADYPDVSGHEVYTCGPPVMIEAIKRTFFARGLTPEQLFYDSFEFAHAT